MSELLKSAISEIDYALVSNKGGKEVREHYLNNAKRYINEAEKEQEIQLNEDQQVVLDWLKCDAFSRKTLNPVGSIGKLNKCDVTENVAQAFVGITDSKQFEVLQAFAEWGLSDK